MNKACGMMSEARARGRNSDRTCQRTRHQAPGRDQMLGPETGNGVEIEMSDRATVKAQKHGARNKERGAYMRTRGKVRSWGRGRGRGPGRLARTMPAVRRQRHGQETRTAIRRVSERDTRHRS